MKSITDMPKACKILKKHFGLTDADLLQYTKLTLSDITKLYEKTTGDKKGSRKKVEEIMNEVIAAKEKSPVLAKKQN